MQAWPAQPSRQQHFQMNLSPEYLKLSLNTSVSLTSVTSGKLHSVLCAARWTLLKDKCSLYKTPLPSTLEHQVPILLTGIIWFHCLHCFLDAKSRILEAASSSHYSASWPTQLPVSDPETGRIVYCSLWARETILSVRRKLGYPPRRWPQESFDFPW